MSEPLNGIVVGVDIGGTKMAAAAVTAAGAPGPIITAPTLSLNGMEDGLRRISQLIAAAAGQGMLRGIGIGCSGPLDTELGVVRNPYTLPGWDGLELIAPLQERFGIPVALINDCDAAALGEAWVGGGQGVARVAYVTVGTGIGAGIVIGGRLLEAPGGVAGEIGHSSVDIDGPPCYCGSSGCLEILAAGPAIEHAVQQAGGPDLAALQALAGPGQPLSAEVVVAGARAGNKLAVATLQRAARYLGAGLANLAVTIAPDRIIIGGGLSNAWDVIGPTAEVVFAARTLIIGQIGTQIVLSKLPNAAILGAARYVMIREGR